MKLLRPVLFGVDGSSPRNWVLITVLAIVAALPYLNTLTNNFVYDDSVQVLENPYIQNFRYIRQIFTTSAWSFTGQGPSNYYRPMMSLGYLFCYRIFGRSAWGFHLVNILLQVAVIGAIFIVTARLYRSRRLAFWASALFALHPIHTESVAWIGGVTDLELTLFYVLTFFFFIKVARPDGGTDRKLQLAMVATFILAAISKEQALTLPVLATLYEHFFREDRAETTWSQKLSRYDLLWMAGALYIAVRIRLLGTFAPLSQFADLSRKQEVLSAVALLGQYFWKLLFPAQLCAFYVFHKSVRIFDWRVLAGGAAAMAYAALFLALWKRARGMAFALVWLLLTLLPVLNAQWVGENVFAERYLYLPSIGFCWLAAAAGLWLWKAAGNRNPNWRRAMAVGLAVVAVLGALRIATRNGDWQDNLTLYQSTLAVSPDAYLIRVDLGAVYDRMGDASDAEREWKHVLRDHPDNAVALADLGMLYARQRLYALGAEFLQRAIAVNPQYADAHIKLGFVYLQAGELDHAEAQFNSSIKMAPMNVGGYAGLAYVCWRRGKNAEAQELLQRAEAVNPSDARVHSSMGQFFAGTGRLEQARREYQTALRLAPDNAEAREGLKELDSKLRP